jgi:predicted nuclease of predicted toxin-antitoxin system
VKFKLDENLSERAGALLVAEGHDVSTVARQGIESAPDRRVIEVCRQEIRALVTLDLDFANPLTFRPSEYPGIAVLRLPKKASAGDLLDVMWTFAAGLKNQDLTGKLWIVERGRIRVFQQEEHP